MCAALARRVAEAGAKRCWREWQVLIGEAVGEGLGVIDPEALVLASLAFQVGEKRLLDRLDWWALRGAWLLSVQRMKTMATSFPQEVREVGLPWFAGRAVRGGDARWKRLAEGYVPDRFAAREGKGPKELALVAPPTLLLRLRAGFGVGVKADLLAALLGLSAERERRATAADLARILGYSSASIRRATGEMAAGGVIRRSASRPPAFFVDQGPWAELLRTGTAMPAWESQGHAQAFLAECHAWALSEESSEVVRASCARDLVERFAYLFDWLGLEVPSCARFRGAAYGAAFEGLVDAVIVAIGAV